MPVTTSKTECCLISMVERMMDSANMPDAIRMLFFLPSALCVRAKWAPMELYTWMLGHRLVGVSACHCIVIHVSNGALLCCEKIPELRKSGKKFRKGLER